MKFAETMNGSARCAFRREDANDAEFRVLNKRHERTNGDALLEMARDVVGSRLIANAAVAGIVLWARYRVAGGSLALGVLAASVLYLRRLYDPIDRLACLKRQPAPRRPRWRRSRALAGPDAVRAGAGQPRRLPALASAQPGREVVFEDVLFAYRTGGEVLPTFSLTIPAVRWPWSARRARASRRSPSCWPASTTPTGRPGPARRRRPARACPCPNCGAGW